MAGTRMSRRSMLGSVSAASFSPVLSAGSPNAAERAAEPRQAPHLQPAFSVRLDVTPATAGEGDRCLRIVGGQASGPGLSGPVQGGSIVWTGQSDGSVKVTTRFAVLRADGSSVEVVDRGIQPHPASGTPIGTTPVLSLPGADFAVPQALMVGRLDASGQAAGVVQLVAFEVA